VKDGKKEGAGILEIDGKVIYKGSFKNDKFDGLGIYYYEDGSM